MSAEIDDEVLGLARLLASGYTPEEIERVRAVIRMRDAAIEGSKIVLICAVEGLAPGSVGEIEEQLEMPPDSDDPHAGEMVLHVRFPGRRGLTMVILGDECVSSTGQPIGIA